MQHSAFRLPEVRTGHWALGREGLLRGRSEDIGKNPND